MTTTDAAESFAGVGTFAGVSILEAAERIRRHETTALETTELALAAAHRYGPELNCFVTIDDEHALLAAREADKELAAGLDRGPLHGIPIGIKDIIATSGLKTTMGSRHFADHIPDSDAPVVTSLRSAGAVVLGKLQCHEFAYGATSDRSLIGPARNPNDTSLVTGGSSGGSGAAVAAGLLPLALSTDTGGSIRIPAALCGVVGLLPTHGALSTDAVFPLSPTMDMVGPITANVGDAAVAWWALSARPDHTGVRRPAWGQWPAPDPERARSLRIAQVESQVVARATHTLAEAVTAAADGFADSGPVVFPLAVPEIDECLRLYLAIQSTEASEIHHQRVQDAPGLFDSEILDLLKVAAGVPGWEYIGALERRIRLRASILERLSSVDMLLMPTVGIDAPSIDQRELDEGLNWANLRHALISMTTPWNVLGFPAISVPVRLCGSPMPSSVQLVGKPGNEAQLLDAAALLELGLSNAMR